MATQHSKKQSVVVIGAGIGGMSTAISLAAAGFEVTVVEKNAQVGGKMGEFRAHGFRWDTGPSVITMKSAFEQLFQRAGRDLHDYIELLPVDPLTRYFFPDGTILDVCADHQRTIQEIREVAVEDAQGYGEYLAYIQRLYKIVSPLFIFDRPPGWHSLGKAKLTDFIQVDGMRSMQAAIEGFVQSPKIQQLLGRFATYVGASPYQTPATLNVIAHVELNDGVWYPRGGIYQIARAYQMLAEELGANFFLNTQVENILLENDRVVGVLTEDGQSIPADYVVSNGDVAMSYRHLLPDHKRAQKEAIRLMKREPSCSGFILLLGVNQQHPELAQHNIFFSTDYAREFQQIFEDEVPPDDPTIYVAITAKETNVDAPAGKENWFVLVNAPALSDKWDWEAKKEGYTQRILAQLAEVGFDVRKKLDTTQVLTPEDIEDQSWAYRGALYGNSSNNRWAAFRRPHNRSSIVEGLYFAGGTTHPGGGVPMVTLSGMVAADLIIEDSQR